MSKWGLIVLLGLQAHFAASYLVPLDERSQRDFGGLLRWVWPWSDGDGGMLGRVTVTAGQPTAGIFIAILAGSLLVLGALAALGLWVPSSWLRMLAIAGSALLVCLMALFVSPTKVLPLAIAAATVYLAIASPSMFASA